MLAIPPSFDKIKASCWSASSFLSLQQAVGGNCLLFLSVFSHASASFHNFLHPKIAEPSHLSLMSEKDLRQDKAKSLPTRYISPTLPPVPQGFQDLHAQVPVEGQPWQLPDSSLQSPPRRSRKQDEKLKEELMAKTDHKNKFLHMLLAATAAYIHWLHLLPTGKNNSFVKLHTHTPPSPKKRFVVTRAMNIEKQMQGRIVIES